jgi:hypothetical protein
MANTCNKEIIDTMSALMSQGFTQDEVCAAVDVHPTTFENWRKKGGPHYEKDFAEAYQQTKVKQKSWWLKRGRDNIGEGKDFNTPLFGLYMANMFGWRAGASRDDEALQEIKRLKEQLGIEDS